MDCDGRPKHYRPVVAVVTGTFGNAPQDVTGPGIRNTTGMAEELARSIQTWSLSL